MTDTNKGHFKKYHRLTYVLALIHSKVGQKYEEDNKRLFLNEILSDLLSNSSIMFIGFLYASHSLTRRSIENFYNHIFYFDHPVEYELLNLGRNEYIAMVGLKEYYESYPLIKTLDDINIKKFNDQLFGYYQELCRTVHTKGEDFMSLAKNLDEIKPDFKIEEHIDAINKSLISIIYLLVKFHRDISFSNTEKDLISKTFPQTFRKQLLS